MTSTLGTLDEDSPTVLRSSSEKDKTAWKKSLSKLSSATTFCALDSLTHAGDGNVDCLELSPVMLGVPSYLALDSSPESSTGCRTKLQDRTDHGAEPYARAAVGNPGSASHGSGDCRPCAWFHKPQGCQNGDDCRHCHLCPEGEAKARRKRKVERLRSGCFEESAKTGLALASPDRGELKVGRSFSWTSTGAQSSPEKQDQEVIADPLLPPPGLSAVRKGTREPEYSLGAERHGTGDCRPCAWFYKQQGCENGAECRHCHMCPEGEIRARRKAKANGLVAGSPKAHVAPEAKLSLEARGDEAKELPSVGSILHESHMCRPCAWFHKAQGCKNGDQCRHCHLCGKGEIRDRRKKKVAAIREQGGDVAFGSALQAIQKQQEAIFAATWHARAMLDFAAMASAQAEMAFAAAAAASPLTSETMAVLAGTNFGSISAVESAQAGLDAGEASLVAGAFHAPAWAVGAFGAASVASMMHCTGHCRPCVRFWKGGGCLEGVACTCCHLCDTVEGKDKEATPTPKVAQQGPGYELVRASSQSPSSASQISQKASSTRSPKIVDIASSLLL